MNRWLQNWLAVRCESPKSRVNYSKSIRVFSEFCSKRWNKDFNNVVEEWRRVRRNEVDREDFLDSWNDIIRGYHAHIKPRYAPLTTKLHLTVIRSFFKFWKIPLDIDLPKRACVIYHNRDLTRQQLRQILTYASPRDRVIWLLMAESGMRAQTAKNLKYWQIKHDFDSGTLPLRILTPSSSLKDHVGDRWTFCGEDGYRELKEYLQPRLPLADDDFVFISEKGKHFSVASLSMKFSRIVLKLGLDKPRTYHKPKAIRQHSLRKYFRNNCRADSAFREFWMGHSLGTDAHYITRNPEVHRREYTHAYPYLRVWEPDEALTKTYVTMTQLQEELKRKDQQIVELRGTVAALQTGQAQRQVEIEAHVEKRFQQEFARLEAQVDKIMAEYGLKKFPARKAKKAQRKHR